MSVGLANPAVMQKYAAMVANDIYKYKAIRYDPNGQMYLNGDGTPYVAVQMNDVAMLVKRWAGAIQQATSSGLPPVVLSICGAKTQDGCFCPDSWILELSSELFLQRHFLGFARCGEIASTIYHELRHAEQYYLMAYYVWIDFPKLSETEVCYKVAGMNLNAVRKARLQAQVRNQGLYEFGKRMYQGELGSAETQYKELLKLCKERVERIRALCARSLPNIELERAAEYNRLLAEEIREYNQTRPAGFIPLQDVIALAEGKAFHIPELWRDLKVASRNFQQAPNAYYKAYHSYLVAKWRFAKEKWRKAYEAYSTSATEFDAFAVEAYLKLRLKKAGLDLDAGTRTVRMVFPTPYSVPETTVKPLLPKLPSSASNLRPY